MYTVKVSYKGRGESWPSGESIQGATTTHQRDMYIYMCYLFSSFYAGKVCVKSQTITVSSKGGQVGGKWFSTTKMGPFVNLVVLLIFCTKTVISAFLLCWWSAGR